MTTRLTQSEQNALWAVREAYRAAGEKPVNLDEVLLVLQLPSKGFPAKVADLFLRLALRDNIRSLQGKHIIKATIVGGKVAYIPLR